MRYFLAFPFFVVGGVITLIGMWVAGNKESDYYQQGLEKLEKWIERHARKK